MEKGSHVGHLQELLLGFPYEFMCISTSVYTHAFLTLPLHISSAFLNNSPTKQKYCCTHGFVICILLRHIFKVLNNILFCECINI